MPRRVIIFDTTLRDGEQCPGASMEAHEKLEIARQLARLGVDIIEAGFPIASPGDAKAVRLIGESVKGPTICALARSLSADIDAAAHALSPASMTASSTSKRNSGLVREASSGENSISRQ